MTERLPRDGHAFAAHAASWWDEGSPMNALRSLNPPCFARFDQFVTGGWSGQRVLDVGCGGGHSKEFPHRRGAVVSGVDPSGALIDVATRHARDTGRDIDYRVGRAEDLPYSDASFPVVTCVGVLEHVTSPARAIREIRRVLAPGGLLLYATINRTFRSRVLMVWLPEGLLRTLPRATHDWRGFVRPAELLGHLDDAGLSPVGRMAGIAVRGRHRDGTLRTRAVNGLSCTYVGAACRPHGAHP